MSTKTPFKLIPDAQNIPPPEKKFDPEKYRIRHTDEIGKPDIVLLMNGKMVATRKNVFAITGKAKAGKTYLLSLIIKAVLQKGDSQVFSSFLPADRDSILFFDTEQSDFHIHVVLNRIAKMGVENKMQKLFCYSTRGMRKTERREFIKQTILETKGVGLAIIDGVADLIQGVNNEESAEEMMEDLAIWSVQSDISIGFVLHQNPSDSIKMRGHIGTIATNKCETTLQVASTKENDYIKLVDTTFTRNAKPDPFSFEILEDGTPEIMNEVYTEPSNKKPKLKILNNFEKYSLLNTVYAGNIEGIPSTVLSESIHDAYTKAYGEVSIRTIETLIKYCKEKNWLVSDGHKQPYLLYPFKE